MNTGLCKWSILFISLLLCLLTRPSEQQFSYSARWGKRAPLNNINNFNGFETILKKLTQHEDNNEKTKVHGYETTIPNLICHRNSFGSNLMKGQNMNIDILCKYIEQLKQEATVTIPDYNNSV